MIADPVNLEELLRAQIVANTESDSVGETFREIGNDLHQEIAVDSVRFARAPNDQPVATGVAGHYSRISSTKRF